MKSKRDAIPNDCAIVATVAAWRLMRENGVPAKILMFSCPDHDEAHACVAFATPTGGVIVYDEKGSRDLQGISLSAPAIDIARRAFGQRVTKAYFYPGLKHTLESISRNRRLSPRECRGGSLFRI